MRSTIHPQTHGAQDHTCPTSVVLAASAVVNNSIYIIGGQDEWLGPKQNINVDFNQIYTPANDTWSLGAPIPVATLEAGAGATTGVMAPEQIYVFGNSISLGEGSNQNYAYNPTTNSWASGATMPNACYNPAVAVVNDLIYVIGGGQYMNALSTNQQYTPHGYRSPTTVTATTDSGATVNLAISGNITSSQMSNVTIATNQSAATTTVSFTVTAERGTTGFGNITIPISLVPYGTTPTICIDGQPASNQGYTQNANNYYVWYTTNFGTHQMSIVFATTSTPSPTPTVPEFSTWIILPLFAIAILLSIIITRKSKNSVYLTQFCEIECLYSFTGHTKVKGVLIDAFAEKNLFEPDRLR